MLTLNRSDDYIATAWGYFTASVSINISVKCFRGIVYFKSICCTFNTYILTSSEQWYKFFLLKVTEQVCAFAPLPLKILLNERKKDVWININSYNRKKNCEGAWVAQSVERPTLHFSSDHDPRVSGFSPTWGSSLSLERAWDSLSLFPSPTCALTLSP